jgi:uncharacterized membrane protein
MSIYRKKNTTEVISNILYILILGIFFIMLLTQIIHSIKIDNKIKEPEHCLKINNDYYCKVEG